jgi:uncharacterized protein (TIGR04255 family)
VSSPFGPATPGHIPLQRPPLIRALAQVRFPTSSAFVGDEDGVAKAVAAALAVDYPIFQESREVSLTITPDGFGGSPGGARIWRLISASGRTSVNFGGSFLAIETADYTRRSEFVGRLATAWDALTRHARPPFVERLGVRYTNRIEDPAQILRLQEMIRPEVLGVVAVDPGNARLVTGLSEAQYQMLDGSTLQARWGLLPGGLVVDPTLPAATETSWLLDLDAYRVWSPGECSGDQVGELAGELALSAYQFFRWTMTAEALGEFGGDSDGSDAGVEQSD